MTVGSLFAGIGGFDLGFERAGCRVVWQAEQDTNAQKVLRRRFNGARMFNDVKAITADTAERVDIICGGFPCQDVSVAGKREGLGGARTGLFWEVVRIARELQPRFMVIENVPGLLTSHRGRDFHTVLAALAECGFRREFRILDSRHFGVAQRRRRVFLVLRARDASDGAVPILFEPESRSGHLATSAEAGPRVAATLRGRSHGAGVNHQTRGGEDDQNIVTYALGSHAGAADGDQTNRSHASGGPVGMGISKEVSHSLRAGRAQTVASVHAFDWQSGGDCWLNVGDQTTALQAGQTPAIFATLNSAGEDGGFRTEPGEHLVAVPPERERALVGSMHKRHDDDTDTLIPTLSASMGHHGHSSPRGDGCDPIVPLAPGGVRRLTPLECERLQNFPDGWTCGCGEGHRGSTYCTCPDSPRYKQLGNAVTVSVAEWIARRIVAADARERVA